MAKRKRTLPEKMKKTQWKKGQSGNPKGAKKLSPELKKFKKLTTEEFALRIRAFFKMSEKEIKETLKHPDTIMLDHLIGSIVQKGVFEGDPRRLDALINRIVGGVLTTHKHDVEVSGHAELVKAIVKAEGKKK